MMGWKMEFFVEVGTRYGPPFLSMRCLCLGNVGIVDGGVKEICGVSGHGGHLKLNHNREKYVAQPE